MKKTICIILAVIFYVLGIIGLALPVIPQIPFLVLGTFFISMGSEKARDRIRSHALYHKYLEKYIDPYLQRQDDAAPGTEAEEPKDTETEEPAGTEAEEPAATETVASEVTETEEPAAAEDEESESAGTAGPSEEPRKS